jgi:hypothetical protein
VTLNWDEQNKTEEIKTMVRTPRILKAPQIDKNKAWGFFMVPVKELQVNVKLVALYIYVKNIMLLSSMQQARRQIIELSFMLYGYF